jgi:hypothetical protein
MVKTHLRSKALVPPDTASTVIWKSEPALRRWSGWEVLTFLTVSLWADDREARRARK